MIDGLTDIIVEVQVGEANNTTSSNREKPFADLSERQFRQLFDRLKCEILEYLIERGGF